MKKTLSLTALLLALANPCFAEDFEGVYDKYQVVYSPSAKIFSPGGMAEDRIVLTKKTSAGSGGYSEYYKNNKLALVLGSNYEFIAGTRLIASHSADLTFYNVEYNKGKFSEKMLNEAEVQELFPDAKIVKISEFVDGETSIKKPLFKNIKILLLNDTNKSFYKYSFSPESVKKTDVAGLLEIDNMGKIEFSHYGEDSQMSPKYTINVGWSFF